MFISGIMVYGLMWMLLGNSSGESLDHNQWKEFMSLGMIITGVGLFFSATFHIGTKEPKKEHKYGGHDNIAFEPEEPFDKPVQERIKEKAQHELDVKALARMYSSSPELKLKDYSLERGAHWVFQPCEAVDSERGIGDSSTIQVASLSIPEKHTKLEKAGLGEDTKDPEQGIVMTGIGAKKQKPMSAKKWFRKPEFYTLCMVFMCTKIVINVSNSYFPLYLVDVLHLEKEAIAYFPLIVLVASAVFSYLSKRITKLLGNKVSYCLASGMVIGAFVWFYFQTIGAKDAIYGAAILMGGGYSVMLVTMLTMVAEMINHIDKESGAFVYGAASLLDKLGNGVLIAIVQEFYPKSDSAGVCAECDTYVRHVFPITTGSAAVLGLVIVLFCYKTRTDPVIKAVQGKQGLAEVCAPTDSTLSSPSASTSGSPGISTYGSPGTSRSGTPGTSLPGTPAILHVEFNTKL
ncbi:uncharacterized protein LOC5512548 isoform X2 [Nematostella vectensis]|nr:uncharacterized protein LOC5512548 isoform X2 [Nematostella vectensis]